MRVDVYRVGALKDLHMACRCLVMPRPPMMTWKRWRRARGYLGRAFSTPCRHVRRGQWRELKNDFNGYLAEPTPWPDGMTRCGSGWTRRRALRSLRRNAEIIAVGVDRWDELDREVLAMMGGGA